MTTLTIQVPDKFKSIFSTEAESKKITSYFVEDYLQELYQDMQTKNELENNSYDKELNNKLKMALWI
jgi:hypothetical protein